MLLASVEARSVTGRRGRHSLDGSVYRSATAHDVEDPPMSRLLSAATFKSRSQLLPVDRAGGYLKLP